MNIRFIVQYDGTRYEGWQRQVRTKETIQGKLEQAIAQVTGETVQIQGAGRTDAGVHSRGQTANVRLKKKVDILQFGQPCAAIGYSYSGFQEGTGQFSQPVWCPLQTLCIPDSNRKP